MGICASSEFIESQKAAANQAANEAGAGIGDLGDFAGNVADKAVDKGLDKGMDKVMSKLEEPKQEAEEEIKSIHEDVIEHADGAAPRVECEHEPAKEDEIKVDDDDGDSEG